MGAGMDFSDTVRGEKTSPVSIGVAQPFFRGLGRAFAGGHTQSIYVHNSTGQEQEREAGELAGFGKNSKKGRGTQAQRRNSFV